MIEKVPALHQLCRSLQKIPYLASKNLYRVVTYFLTEKPEKVEAICEAILKAQLLVVQCTDCFMWKEKGQDCIFCTDVKRDRQVICVVETWHDLMAIEKTEGYKGLYHVLGGAISPLDGVTADDLSINGLLKRVSSSNECKEIILALNQTPEGEATAAFIARKLEIKAIKVSCLAKGVPVGSHLEMMDKLTVYKALSDRRPF